MILKQIVKKHPLAYEYCMLFYNPFYIKKLQKRDQAFSKLSKEELMNLDSEMYYSRRGKQLDWKNLNTYTEKMQFEKIFDENPQKVILTDKYLVRKWVESKIGSGYLIPLIGVYDSIKDIDFDSLPNSFVIKTNHGSSDVVVVRDKSNFKKADWMRLKRIIGTSMVTNYASYAYEMHYSKIIPKVIVESYIDSGNDDLQDYKFLCFDGVPHFCWVDIGRFHEHKRNVYDLNWNLQKWNQFHYGNSAKLVEKPVNFEKMCEIARLLSQGFSHVRVDLYNVNGEIYFGEMTFTNGSGFEEITPDEADMMLGQLWKLDTTIR